VRPSRRFPKDTLSHPRLVVFFKSSFPCGEVTKEAYNLNIVTHLKALLCNGGVAITSTRLMGSTQEFDAMQRGKGQIDCPQLLITTEKQISFKCTYFFR